METINKHKSFNLFFTGIWLLVASHISYNKYQQTQHQPYWASKEYDNRGRTPSAVLDFDPDSLEIYRDFFSYVTYQKYLTYDLSLNFRTDRDEEHLKDKFNLSLRNSIRNTLIQKTPKATEEGIESHDKGLVSLIKENLIQELTKNFLKTIKAYKIVNGTFQIDLNFSPRINSELNFNEELSSNQLVNWSQTSRLTNEINEVEIPFHQKVFEMPVPATTETYQYKGGQITIWFKTLDTTPQLHLPSPSKRGVKGFIRLRRYFRAPDMANNEPHILDENFRLNMVHFKTLEKRNRHDKNENFVTIDLYKEFDLENQTPRLDRVELHFGKVLPDNFHTTNLIGSLFAYKDNVIETSELNLHGALKYGDKDVLFVSKLEKLVFDFKTGEFSNNSKMKTIFRNSDLRGPHLGQAQHKVYNKLLHEYGLELIRSFHLGEIHSKFGGRK